MPKSLFIIGIGGTGMRCIESFVHLCAMCLFDETEIHLLAMDTDKDNGNFKRFTELQECYLKTKGVNKTHYSFKDSLFSANIKNYSFSPNYFKTDNRLVWINVLLTYKLYKYKPLFN